jgi:hypothetical protein
MYYIFTFKYINIQIKRYIRIINKYSLVYYIFCVVGYDNYYSYSFWSQLSEYYIHFNLHCEKNNNTTKTFTCLLNNTN